MNDLLPPLQAPKRPEPNHPMLETVTAGVLMMVLAALVWMVLAAYWPGTFSVAPIEVELIAILVLLTTALILVSVVALLHTRS